MNKLHDVDVAICYHKPSMIFESDAIKPMQLNKKNADFDLGFRGDDTKDNISEKNHLYSEDTALYWLWKNSSAKIKGCLHYRRLLDLMLPGQKNYQVVMDNIKNPSTFVQHLGLTKSHITKLLKDADILIRNRTNITDFFDGTIEEQFKAVHISYHWDIAIDIVKKDYPEIYPTVLSIAKGTKNYFHNSIIMKSELFDNMCEFCFHITNKLSQQIDESRLEFQDNWRYTARYLSFVFERLAGMYITYLASKGYRIKEFPAVSIVPQSNQNLENIENYSNIAYARTNTDYKIPLAFKQDAISIMMSTDDNYVPCCSVMLQSIIDNSNEARFYDINIISRKISERNKLLLEGMSKSNVSIRIFDITGYLEKYNISKFKINAHFSLDAYSRIFIPDLFSNYKKILYLDVDMVTLKDVAELYDTDIKDNWWGVVQDKFFVTECHCLANSPTKIDLKNYIKDTLKISSIANIFNSGVMLWNITKCIEDKVLEKSLARLFEIKNPKFVDQCILNSLANGEHIYWLSPYWNVFWNVSMHWNDGYGSESYNTALHYLEKPYILHFTGCIKPWNEPWREHAEIFWQYARKTPFYEKMFSKIIFNVYNYLSNNFQPTSPNIKKLRKYKRKYRWYKFLNILSIGTIKSFSRKKKQYHKKIVDFNLMRHAA